jgi:hypothetical protein
LWGWSSLGMITQMAPQVSHLTRLFDFLMSLLILGVTVYHRILTSHLVVGNGIQRVCTKARCLYQDLLNDWPFNLWSF